MIYTYRATFKRAKLQGALKLINLTVLIKISVSILELPACMAQCVSIYWPGMSENFYDF